MSQLKNIRLPVSANLKLVLVLLALVIVASTLWFTQGLVEELKRAEQRTIQFYAKTLQTLLNTTQEPTESSEVISSLALTATEIIYFPMIVTGPDGEPAGEYDPEDMSEVVSYKQWVINVDYDTTAPAAEQRLALLERIDEMKQVYEPLAIYLTNEYEEEVPFGDSTITRTVSSQELIMYIYFDDSTAIKQLQLLPWIELLLISMFILIGYISFSHIKRSEQSNIWVGMAKETAHQLGTPLSSLMGWIELLRLEPENVDQVMEAAEEMDRDVDRLNTVAQRFSKIGSATELKRVDMGEVIEGVTLYFRRRLPHLGKRIRLEFDRPPEPLYASINVELVEWVLENLIRNAADAIERQEGFIRFDVHPGRNAIVIDISDNGKGIDPKIRKDIFRPGFSTKRRGWGLGLSLAKRIIEEYHGGKIFVKETSPEGTTFTLRISTEEAKPAGFWKNGVSRKNELHKAKKVVRE